MGLYLLFWITSLLISLRYRIRVTGLKELSRKKWPHTGGILFLPNHSAEIDPIILMIALWREFKPHPLAVDTFYYQKGIRFFMDLVGTLAIPNMDVANQWKLKRLEKSKQQLFTRLRAGDNFLIYPSGKLKRTAEEKIGGAFLVHDLLQASPDTNIAMIRVTGLWGSIFSCAAAPTSPDFGKTLWQGVKILLKNAIFFAPRREIEIEMSPAPDDFPYRSTRLQLNQYLERWYNARGPEPLKLVRYYFWSREFPKIETKEKQRQKEAIFVPPELERAIIAHLAETTHREENTIQKSMHLSNDLGLDSLDIADLYLFLEEKFRISDLEPGDIQTVEDLIFAAANYKKERERPAELKKRKMRWPKETNRSAPFYPEGDSIQEVFLNSCGRMGPFTACADGLSGAISYRKFKRLVLILALKIKQLPGENIGILLPSTTAAYLLSLATMLAKKVPVMLNWTAGSRAMEHCVEVTELQTILTSFRFLNHLDHADFGDADDLLMLLEEFRQGIGLGIKLQGLFMSFLPSKSLLKLLQLDAIRDKDRAVIIFTSGTETLPKGVPLSHKNLLSNQRSALSCIHFHENDIFYSVLPPFHSFGLSVTGLVPLLTGIKVFYSPDPTHSHGMANDIAKWKPTVFSCAPSFTRGLFKVASDEELQSVRLYVSGAEKAPEELFERVRQMGKKMVEGYGVSECSPIITMGREEKQQKGVGQAIPGVELCLIHPDTKEILPSGQEGEVCIYGPNVFEGYLGYPKSPFITLQGKSWYRSGDMGRLDSEGNLFITGRLKRFFKIGGEMVSLGGLEEELVKICEEKNWSPEKREGPKLAVIGVGRESEKPYIVLFTTFDISVEQVNVILRERGFSRIAKISRVEKLEQIPLTGTGKTHYRLLEEKIASETKTL